MNCGDIIKQELSSFTLGGFVGWLALFLAGYPLGRLPLAGARWGPAAPAAQPAAVGAPAVEAEPVAEQARQQLAAVALKRRAVVRDPPSQRWQPQV